MIVLFGIKNCDTIKKARNWLDQHDIEFQFHDYRTNGLNKAQLQAWCNELGWQQLLNRRGTTWRKLPDEIKDSIDEHSAIALMLEQPAMIKRPLLDTGTQLLLGFNTSAYEHLFKEKYMKL